ncbi:chromosome segregation ATPase [Vibrio harveyi]
MSIYRRTIASIFFLFISQPVFATGLIAGLSMSAQLEQVISNPSIKKDISDSLLGIDKNHNYIRDDVEAVLKALKISEVNHEFLLRYVQYSSSILQHDFSSNDADNQLLAYEIYKDYRYVRHCFKDAGVDGKDLYDAIHAVNRLMFNTDARIVAYLNYEKYIDISIMYEGISYNCNN